MATRAPLLWIRAESRKYEYRAPLIPKDVAYLVTKGFNIVTESSPYRCFSDKEYQKAGAKITYANHWITAPQLLLDRAWVLGLKELPSNTLDLFQNHIFFAHAFKGQKNSNKLLQKFSRNKGAILDLEYLTDQNGSRLTAFGYWAGYVGACLSLLQWLKNQAGQKLENLMPLTKKQLHKLITTALQKHRASLPKCLIIGANGKCGTGAKEALQNFQLTPTLWDKKKTLNLSKQSILMHHLLLNCVFINKKTINFLSLSDLAEPHNLSLICDVSCDCNSSYNPLPIYQKPTTWEKPVIKIGSKKNVSIIAIDNLPSLLPEQASRGFSKQLTPLLLKLPHKTSEWERARQHFLAALQTL